MAQGEGAAGTPCPSSVLPPVLPSLPSARRLPAVWGAEPGAFGCPRLCFLMPREKLL